MPITPPNSGCAKLYMERTAPHLQPTLRTPGPKLCLATNAVNTLPLQPPYPALQVLRFQEVPPPAAGGETTPWPYGAQERI